MRKSLPLAAEVEKVILGHRENGFGHQVIFDPERSESNGYHEAGQAFGPKFDRWCWTQVTVRPEGSRVVISFREEADAAQMLEMKAVVMKRVVE